MPSSLSPAQICFLSAGVLSSLAGAALRPPFPERFGWGAMYGHRRVLARGTAAELARPNGCEAQRKAMTIRNGDELNECLRKARIAPPPHVPWILAIGGAGLLFGLGIVRSGGEARRRLWLGGTVGFLVAGGGATAIQLVTRASHVGNGEEYCGGQWIVMEEEIAREYTNCLARRPRGR